MRIGKSALSLTVFGSRGSVPTPDSRMMRFGGNTSSYMAEAEGQTLLLDGGTGIAGAVPAPGPVHIVFSHFHLDHVMGLPVFPALFEQGREVHLYGRSRDGMDPRAQVACLVSPPLWPATLDQYPAKVFFHELDLPLRIGVFEVDGIETRHPGGSLALRVAACGRSFVYATDFVHTDGEAERLAAFSRGTDLLMHDAQYTPQEFAARPGFGHSTAEAALETFRLSGAKQLLLIHYDPAHTDEMLLAREKQLGVRFAREGEVVEL